MKTIEKSVAVRAGQVGSFLSLKGKILKSVGSNYPYLSRDTYTFLPARLHPLQIESPV
jgi:hypothetical protein